MMTSHKQTDKMKSKYIKNQIRMLTGIRHIKYYRIQTHTHTHAQI